MNRHKFSKTAQIHTNNKYNRRTSRFYDRSRDPARGGSSTASWATGVEREIIYELYIYIYICIYTHREREREREREGCLLPPGLPCRHFEKVGN